MLEFAQKYKKKLEQKILETWGDEKYYYFNQSYFTPIEIKEDTWEKMQFVSVNSSGEVIGYLEYDIDRQCRYVSNLAICNFTEDPSFGIDVKEMIKDIFEKYKFRKIDFSVLIGNPIKPKYDILTKRYGGKVVGFRKEHAMLPNGKICDEKLYEILREDYLTARYGNSAG